VKRAFSLSVKLLVSCGLILYLIARTDTDGVRGAFSRMTPWLFAAAVFLFVVSNVLGALQWHLLLRAQRLALPFGKSLVFYFVGMFFNNVLLGNIGGDAMRIYDIRRSTGQSSSGIAATLMDRFIGLLSTCFLALLAYPLIPDERRAWLVPALLPIWIGLFLLLAAGLSRRIGGFCENLFVRLPPAALGRLVSRLRRSIVVYRHRIGLLAGVWFISLIVQFSRILVYWLAGLALGMKTGLIYFICFQPVAAVFAALPISVGGLGVRETTMIGLFDSVGVEDNLTLAMSLLGYVAGILASLLGGVAFVFRRAEVGALSPGIGEQR
jgi:glycosyltransferase 2 family protein